ncbi:hypothetical protein QR680_005053 [Steinernema hermaphroditum]|uniref:Uncharacterized protein n=1 Tax=Steinernema hermaphroditum TaxID=289476 RepID=A0AA39HQP7_9BILA|nr:hypothetical protein QR680_005053 [Steinernema hermaphroditum]
MKSAVLFLFLLCLCTSGVESARRHRSRHLHRIHPACQQSSKDELMAWFKESVEHESTEVIDTDWVPPAPEPQICYEQPDTSVESTVMQRSLCPWQWKLNHDENREPQILSEAYCLCRKSRGNSGSFCMPIKREVNVLRKILCDPITGRYEYIKAVQTITVGCHSVLPRTQRATPIFRNSNREVK